jgi:hypothetical protein
MSNHGLGRRAPTDFSHVDRYPLTIARGIVTHPTPVVIGVNWYAEFDVPTKDSQGHHWVARDAKLTKVRGGHCVCLKPAGARDSTQRWEFYDQGNEGACVGFGVSRLASFLNSKLYDARWLYHEAQKVDEWPGEDYDGTSVRAGLDVLRTRGHRVYDGGKVRPERAAEGIAANRWITSIDDCLVVLGYGGLDYVDFVNSWGTSYPHVTRMSVAVLERLWKEDGEIGVVTDR